MEKAVRAKALTYFAVVLLFVGLLLTLYAREALELVAPGSTARTRPWGRADLRDQRFRYLLGRSGRDLVRSSDALVAVHRGHRSARQHPPEPRADPAVRHGRGQPIATAGGLFGSGAAPAPGRPARLPDGLRDRQAGARIRARDRGGRGRAPDDRAAVVVPPREDGGTARLRRRAQPRARRRRGRPRCTHASSSWGGSPGRRDSP